VVALAERLGGAWVVVVGVLPALALVQGDQMRLMACLVSQEPATVALKRFWDEVRHRRLDAWQLQELWVVGVLPALALGQGDQKRLLACSRAWVSALLLGGWELLDD